VLLCVLCGDQNLLRRGIYASDKSKGLALLYYVQGNLTAGEPLYRRALMIREQALGPAHPDVAQSLNNLALLYYTQGKFTEAEPLLRRALRIWEQALGETHPHVATCLKNYAMLLRALGREAEATALDARAAASRARHAQQNAGEDA
jgi:tetratricopeptide (TPR) repeat protein